MKVNYKNCAIFSLRLLLLLLSLLYKLLGILLLLPLQLLLPLLLPSLLLRGPPLLTFPGPLPPRLRPLPLVIPLPLPLPLLLQVPPAAALSWIWPRSLVWTVIAPWVRSLPVSLTVLLFGGCRFWDFALNFGGAELLFHLLLFLILFTVFQGVYVDIVFCSCAWRCVGVLLVLILLSRIPIEFLLACVFFFGIVGFITLIQTIRAHLIILPLHLMFLIFDSLNNILAILLPLATTHLLLLRTAPGIAFGRPRTRNPIIFAWHFLFGMVVLTQLIAPIFLFLLCLFFFLNEFFQSVDV